MQIHFPTSKIGLDQKKHFTVKKGKNDFKLSNI